MRQISLRMRHGNERGAALVEFAIVAMLLLTLVFGIIEFGLMMKDYLTLNQAVREGSRAAALGSTLAEVQSLVVDSAPTAIPEKLSNVTLHYRTRTGGVWSDWSEVPDGGEAAPPADTAEGVQVKVSANYTHDMVTGSLFGAGPVTLSAEMVMRRE